MYTTIIEIPIDSKAWELHIAAMDKLWGSLTPVEIATAYDLTRSLKQTVDKDGGLHEQCKLYDLYVESLIAEVGPMVMLKMATSVKPMDSCSIDITYVGERVGVVRFTFT